MRIDVGTDIAKDIHCLHRELAVEALATKDRIPSADALAAAAGIAPVLRQSGKTRFLRRPAGGNKGPKRVSCQFAFCSLGQPDSHVFYTREPRERNRHQAFIAVARRRVNVRWAMLQTRSLFQVSFKIVV
ncbi:transposase [Phyllobacterium zundukense]|uniref:Transposase n=1 Tax=Phyllobacterium zundukense TaxID=1867719 RepID=A0ACD4CVS8_9HYPH|nr:transposase [Phyllobacterium zundukense]UXN57690.1 transposase [Phyllobacterium zundukense]